MTDGEQRAQLDYLKSLNQLHRDRLAAESELSARIESFELAYRMQSAAPEAIEIDREPAHIKKLYGLDDPRCDHVARQCLVARRLVERGVRFVQIYSGGMDNQLSWDGHNDIKGNHEQFAGETDKPLAGLLTDLDQRGLLEETLVIWGGEFGRLPIAQKSEKPGRDHNPHAFTFWLAGGGVKGGVSHGETDEIGYHAVVDRVPRQRPACDDPPAARARSRTTHLQVQRQTLPPDRRRRQGHHQDHRLKAEIGDYDPRTVTSGCSRNFLSQIIPGGDFDRAGCGFITSTKGQGEPVVMLHGNPTWSFYYRHLIDSLRGSHRVIVPDHIGCGLSDKPDDSRYTYTLDSRVDDLERLLDHLGLDRDLTLVLHDWGGMIGMAYAARHPERIARLVVSNTAAFHKPASKPMPRVLAICRSSLLAALLVRGANVFCHGTASIGCKRRPMTRDLRRAYVYPYDSWSHRIAILRFVQDIPLRPGDRSYELVSWVAGSPAPA